MRRSTRSLRSRLGRLEATAGEYNSPEAVREAARHRIAEGTFPAGAPVRLCIDAGVLLAEALRKGWDPATDVVPLPADRSNVDYLGVGPTPKVRPVSKLRHEVLGELIALGVNPIAF